MKDTVIKYQKGFRPIEFAVTSLHKTLAKGKGALKTELVLKWLDIVGRDIGGKSSPANVIFSKNGNLANNCLHLKVTPPYGLEIQLSIPQILEKINNYFGYKLITRIKIMQRH